MTEPSRQTEPSQQTVGALPPFAGLIPTRVRLEAERARRLETEPRRSKSVFSTLPVILVGSLALATMNVGTLDDAQAKRPHRPGTDTADLGTAVMDALANASADAPATTTTLDASTEIAPASIPSTYSVRGGDSVSSIAARYGLSTASVLAMNGLGWKTVIFPGQVLKLSKSGKAVAASAHAKKPSASSSSSKTTRYIIRSGDTLTGIARKFGVSITSLLRANHLSLGSTIYAGRQLTIPGVAPAVAPPAATPIVTPPVVNPPTDVTPPATTPPTTSTTYTIRTGDTITSIAKFFGVTVTALLQANNLTPTSIIYAGRTLVIPGIQPASVGPIITPLSPTMRTNAAIIVSVGKSLSVPDYGIIVALAAAAQESGLVNLDYGDRDSVGLFQQRPSAGWGLKAKLMDPSYASRLFFGGPTNPNAGITRGLLDIPGWQKMTVTQAAQAVQNSAFPNAYAKWEASARAWFASLS